MTLVITAAVVTAALQAAPAQRVDAFSKNGLHYTIEGRGPDVVLVHAFQMDLREWDAVAAALAGSRRVIRYDVRGHGTSKVDGDLPSSVSDLVGLLDELQIRRATIAGLSMGSTIALDFALTHPDRVERLVLAAPGIPGVAGGRTPEWLTPVFTAVKGGDSRRAAELWWGSPLFDAVRTQPAGERAKTIVLDNARIWTFARRPPGLDPPAGTRLKEVAIPVVTVAGDADQLGGHDIAKTVAAAVPNGRFVPIAGAGHMLTVERPADLARIILEK